MSVVWSVDHKVLFEQVGLHIGDNAKVSLDTLLAIAQMHPPPLALRALLDHDLNAFGRGFAAFASMNSATSTTLTGPYFVQIDAMDDASTPKRRVQSVDDDADDDASSNRRCLKFRLSDGVHKFDALEFASLAEIVDFDRTPPGTKLVLRNVRVVRGWALLTPECVQVIGGSVEALVKVFQFNRTMARRERSLARPVAARDPGDPGPPQFTLPTDLHTASIKTAQSSSSTTSTSVSTADVDTRLPPGLDNPATRLLLLLLLLLRKHVQAQSKKESLLRCLL